MHVGTEAALVDGNALVNADETWPLKPDSRAYYPRSKARAEQAVVAANGAGGMETVVVRPRFVWGPGDTTLLPGIVELIRSGKFAWVGGGGNLTSTAHVDNVVEGLVLAAEKGRGGEAYFVTDGDPIPFREMITALVATQGVEPGKRNVPAAVAQGGRGGGGGRVAHAAPEGRAADHAPRRLELRAGVHRERRQGARGARLPAGHLARGRPGALLGSRSR